MITQWKQQPADTIGSIGKLILAVISRRRGLLEKVPHQHLRTKLVSLLDDSKEDDQMIWSSMKLGIIFSLNIYRKTKIRGSSIWCFWWSEYWIDYWSHSWSVNVSKWFLGRVRTDLEQVHGNEGKLWAIYLRCFVFCNQIQKREVFILLKISNLDWRKA